MALLFMDSFDHYATADVLEKWTAQESTIVGQLIGTGLGRRGTNAWRAGSTNRGLVRAVPSSATIITGRALNLGGAPSGAGAILQLMEAGTPHITVRANIDLSLSVLRGTTGGTLLATTAAGVLSGSGYDYIEFKATINDTTGSYELRVNGANVLSGSGLDTRNGLTGVITSVALIAIRLDELWDDVYICDSSGSTNNDFLGDVRVDCFFPSGNGNSSQLVGSDSNSVDNYLLVDESAPNDDTDYVQSATVGDKDTYSFPNLSHTPSVINGIQVCMNAKKDDSGSRSISSVIRSGGTDTNGTTRAISTSYSYHLQISETDPNTSAAWTQAGFNAAEFGHRVAA
jgi:hypothetical protein